MRRIGFLLVLLIAVFAPATLFASADGQFERTLKVSGTPQVDVSTGSGDITVHTGQAGDVRVIGRIHVSAGWFSGGNEQEKVRRIESNPPIQQTGAMIRIGRISDPDLRRNISISYEIWTPAETVLRADTGSGNVKVENLKNSVELSTGSGDVFVANVANAVRARTGSGTIRADGIGGSFSGETGSGDIRVAMVAKANVRVRTGSGGINVSNATSSLSAHTGSGDVEAAGTPDGQWEVETGSGNVRLQIPQGARFDVAASTSSGRIDVSREMVTSGTVNQHRIRGKVNGGGPLLQLQTASGDIIIR